MKAAIAPTPKNVGTLPPSSPPKSAPRPQMIAKKKQSRPRATWPPRRATLAPACAAERDAALLDYFESRKTLGQVIHRLFGGPGLQLAADGYSDPAHRNAVAALRQRLTDPAFAAQLSPLERAEIELLAANPLDFISCIARRGRA
jgi:hypothetical protein